MATTNPSDAGDTSSLDEPINPAIQQVLTAMENAALSIEEALQITVVLLDFLEGIHLDTLEQLLEEQKVDGAGIAVWAADSARLRTARELLELVLGEEEDAEEELGRPISGGDDGGDDDGDGDGADAG